MLSQDWWELKEDGELRGEAGSDGRGQACSFFSLLSRLRSMQPVGCVAAGLPARPPAPRLPARVVQCRSRRAITCLWSGMTWCALSARSSLST